MVSTINGQSKIPSWGGIWAMTFCVAGIMIGEFLPAGLLTPIAHDLNIAVQLSAAAGAVGAGIIFDFKGSNGVYVLSALSWIISAIVALKLRSVSLIDHEI